MPGPAWIVLPTYCEAENVEPMTHALRAVLPGVLPVRPARLLELGCGSGNMLEMLAEFGEAVGVAARRRPPRLMTWDQ